MSNVAIWSKPKFKQVCAHCVRRYFDSVAEYEFCEDCLIAASSTFRETNKISNLRCVKLIGGAIPRKQFDKKLTNTEQSAQREQEKSAKSEPKSSTEDQQNVEHQQNIKQTAKPETGKPEVDGPETAGGKNGGAEVHEVEMICCDDIEGAALPTMDDLFAKMRRDLETKKKAMEAQAVEAQAASQAARGSNSIGSTSATLRAGVQAGEEIDDDFETEFIKSYLDPETIAYLQQCAHNHTTLFGLREVALDVARTFLKKFWSNTDVNGFLGTGRMWLMSEHHVRRMLLGGIKGPDKTETYGHHILDIGAGSGHITEKFRRFFSGKIHATEVSANMCRSMRRKGFVVFDTYDFGNCKPLWEPKYDLICSFNVLDRCTRPLTFLRDLRRLCVKNECKAMIGVVFPFSQWIEAHVEEREELVDRDGSLFEKKLIQPLAEGVVRSGKIVKEVVSNVSNKICSEVRTLRGNRADTTAIEAIDNVEGDIRSLSVGGEVVSSSSSQARGGQSKKENSSSRNGHRKCCGGDVHEHIHYPGVGSHTLPIEKQVASFVDNVLTPIGWRICKFSRLPYASSGDRTTCVYVLTNGIFLMEPCEPTEKM